MEKIYIKPQVEIIKLEVENAILTGSSKGQNENVTEDVVTFSSGYSNRSVFN